MLPNYFTDTNFVSYVKLWLSNIFSNFAISLSLKLKHGSEIDWRQNVQTFTTFLPCLLILAWQMMLRGKLNLKMSRSSKSHGLAEKKIAWLWVSGIYYRSNSILYDFKILVRLILRAFGTFPRFRLQKKNKVFQGMRRMELFFYFHFFT